MHVRKIAWSNHSCWPVDQPKSSLLFLLPWYTATAGYRTSRKTSYSQWLATDKEEIRYEAQVSQGEKTTANGRFSWQFKYVNTILIILCMSNGLICAYITSIHDKRIVTSCTTWHLPQTIRVFQYTICWLFCRYATNNL